MNEFKNTPLISVVEAEQIILNEAMDFGFEKISIDESLGRTLANDLNADRDFPPFNRVTMDGIAIKYSPFLDANSKWKIQSVQSAGQTPHTLANENDCIEVMTGAVLPINTDTVIRYESLKMDDGFAYSLDEVKPKINIHYKGEDRRTGDILVKAKQKIRAAEIAIAASIGATELTVYKLPKVAIITSGDELVSIDRTPEPHQIRTSNVYAINPIFKKYGINSTNVHIHDSLNETISSIENALGKFDILILSGGVSMGKKDFIPAALEKIGVVKLFHKIAQTPGKPFWFGKKGNKLIFALPGNPVSTYLCCIRYIMPWLDKSLGIKTSEPAYAELAEDFIIKTSFTYFLQVKLRNEKAQLLAYPIKGHGSGDFANLVDADAFLELPAFDRNEFKKGEIFKVWSF